MKFIKWFKEIRKKNIALAGGKGAQLGELYNSSFPVPEGFVITSAAYGYFIESSHLRQLIHRKLSTLNVENTKELEIISGELRKSIISCKIPEDLKHEIFNAYNQLKGSVAVRSSATTEDLPNASFAGQQD